MGDGPAGHAANLNSQMMNREKHHAADHHKSAVGRSAIKSMQPVLTAGAMREADRFTIEDFGIAGRTLMETAGREAAAIIERHFGPAADLIVTICCGNGNNGGDGFVAARYLHQHGAHVHVFTLGDIDSMSADAAANFRLLQRLVEHDGGSRLHLVRFGTEPERATLPTSAIYVDALLGTGVASELRDPILSIIRRLNERSGGKVAIDIPTGLHTDTGIELGAAFRAQLTITIGARKAGLCLNLGPSLAGEIETVDIGIPTHVLWEPAATGTDGCALLSTDESVAALLPGRSPDANKYSAGYAFVVAGSVGMTGAPVMAATAAARSGAGYVSCACDDRIQEVLSVKLTEITTIGLPSSPGGIDPDAAMSAMSDRLSKADAALIGCGLGRETSTSTFIRRFLETVDLPLVVDADGINALEGHTDLLRKRSGGRWILTPHLGEFKRLAGGALERSGIQADDRIRLTQFFAREWNCILVLKGMPSVIAAPDGRAWIHPTGNTGLATAGSGDVLAGMCVGLMAQGLEPVAAAIAGLHLGGACAERYAVDRDSRTLQATDLLNHLPSVLKERFSTT